MTSNQIKTLCVYCSSSDAVAPDYFQVATELGTQIGQQGFRLVYGGARIGLMGTVARAVTESGGSVTGIMPEKIHQFGISYEPADEFLVTPDMRHRKAEMERRADAFIALPGGFGTLEEIMEVITLKQLRYHSKPIIFLNTNGFYDKLYDFMEHIYSEKFAKPEYRNLYYSAADVPSVFAYLENYDPTPVADKWFK